MTYPILQKRFCKRCEQEKFAYDFTPKVAICKACNNQAIKERRGKSNGKAWGRFYFNSNGPKCVGQGVGRDQAEKIKAKASK